MTPHLKEVIELKIKKIKAALAAEKRKFGCYDDSRGLRYLPTTLYLKLQDYQGGLAYTRWFSKNFPDDAGFPDFLFEWTVILFKNGNIREAERKVLEAYFRNTYLFDKFFGRPIKKINKDEYSSFEMPEYVKYFKYSDKQSDLADFSIWLKEFEQSEKFKEISKRFIYAQIRLKDEDDDEMRHYLVRIDKQLLNEI